MDNPDWVESLPASRAAIDADEAAQVAAAKRDPAAFAPLYQRYVDPVYRYCLRRLGTKEAAEDATSLVFAKVLAALPKYREGGHSFRSWLFAIAHNVVADAGRTHRPEQALNLAEAVAAPEPGPEDEALAAEERRSVRALLARMAPEQQRVLELRLAGLTTAEVALSLDRSPGAVRATQFRAATRLRSLLGIAPARQEANHG